MGMVKYRPVLSDLNLKIYLLLSDNSGVWTAQKKAFVFFSNLRCVINV